VQGTKILETSDAKVKKSIYFVSFALSLMWVTVYILWCFGFSIEGITVNFYRYVHLMKLLHVCQE